MSDVSYGFFPTTNEVFNGIKWIKEHPMVATAAAVGATALSLVTYIRSTKENVETTPIVSWCDRHVKADASRPQQLTDESDEEESVVHDVQILTLKKEATWAEDVDPSTCQTASPQWGWYVAITPPTDFGHNLPRAITDPSHYLPSTAASMTLKRTQSAQLR